MTHTFRARIVLAGLSGLALVLTAALNYQAGQVLQPAAGWIADAALPSCLGIWVLAGLLGTTQGLRWPAPRAPWPRVVQLSGRWLGGWLGASALVALGVGHWSAYAHTPSTLAAFLLFGPIGEEVLFRGAVFEQALRAFPANPTAAHWLSAALFSGHHLALHQFQIQPFVLA